MYHQAEIDSRFVPLADAEPAVSTSVLQIVAVGFATGILGVVLGAVAGFGLWGLILTYIAAGNAGVASVILARVAA